LKGKCHQNKLDFVQSHAFIVRLYTMHHEPPQGAWLHSERKGERCWVGVAIEVIRSDI